MTEGARILGRLRVDDGRGIVRIEDHFDTDIDDVWSALTEPRRLERWLGKFDGDLRLGGTYHGSFFASGAEVDGRVAECDPPHRFRLVIRESDPAEQTVVVTLTPAGERTMLVIEHSGLPVDMLPGYGAGIQIHVEDLAAYLAGQDRCDSNARMEVLYPAYRSVAVD